MKIKIIMKIEKLKQWYTGESVHGAIENSHFTQNTSNLTVMEVDFMDMENLLQFSWTTA
jgi:hypothetical protein